MPHCCKLSALKKPCSCQEMLHRRFYPGPCDVICARGKAAKSHPGNIRYQTIVESYLDRYVKSMSKLQKMSIISEIVAEVRICSPNGGFVKKKEGRWYEVGDHFAREKVSQSLRDSLHAFYRSSCKSKTIRRSAIRRKETEKSDETVPRQNKIQHSSFVLSSISDTSAQPKAASHYRHSLGASSLVPESKHRGVPIVGANPKAQLTLFQQVGHDQCAVNKEQGIGSPPVSPSITESDLMVARILLAQAHQPVAVDHDDEANRVLARVKQKV
mmetsp:Transcript_51419/g.142364  ORF Transcript_51419/g.142364 Transcript_51419/m.142364 type:complete len:271 (+) Transcript_51419:92-904(+)